MKSRLPSLIIVLLLTLTGTSSAWAMYNPSTGRFLQRDSVGYVDGTNLYQYVGSRPTHYVDPSGHLSVSFVKRDGYINKRLKNAVGQAIPSASVTADCVKCDEPVKGKCWMMKGLSVDVVGTIYIDEAAFEGGKKHHGEGLVRVYGHEEQHIKAYEQSFNGVSAEIQKYAEGTSLAGLENECAFKSEEACKGQLRDRGREIERTIKKKFKKNFSGGAFHKGEPQASPGTPGEFEGFDPEGDPSSVGNHPDVSHPGEEMIDLR